MTSLSSLYMDAFTEVAQTKNFSRAAERLHITQSALSQRILNLEAELKSTLFIRERAGVRLTEVGYQLLRYCQKKNTLENEFRSGLYPKNKRDLIGEIRIGGFSSVMGSVIIPAISSLLKSNPKVKLYLVTRELSDLPDLLKHGEIDFMVLDHQLDRDDLNKVKLGIEKNVLVRPLNSKSDSISHIYLDHDETDQITRRYLKLAKQSSKEIERRYLDDVYGLIEGVRAGIGKAILPLHLLKNIEDVTIVHRDTVLEVPVFLHYYTQPFYSDLQKRVIENLVENCPKILS